MFFSGGKVAAAPVVLGVALTWFGEMDLSLAAAAVSISCVALNASKVVINSEMLSGDYKVRCSTARVCAVRENRGGKASPR